MKIRTWKLRLACDIAVHTDGVGIVGHAWRSLRDSRNSTDVGLLRLLLLLKITCLLVCNLLLNVALLLKLAFAAVVAGYEILDIIVCGKTVQLRSVLAVRHQ